MAGLIPFNKYFGRPAVFEEFYNMLDDFLTIRASLKEMGW